MYRTLTMFGIDVEFPVANKAGNIVGGEVVLKGKIDGEYYPQKRNHGGGYDGEKKDAGYCSLDGTVIEINPAPSSCRAYIVHNLSNCFETMRKQLGKEYNLVHKDVVKFKEEHFEKIAPANRLFGCKPDYSAYGGVNKVTVNPQKHLTRCAGGHVHICGDHRSPVTYNIHDPVNACRLDNFEKVLIQPNRVVPVLDILVGNMCVLLDRSEDAAKRRELYGKAGDYRLPAWGLEYRTLSNFWLHDEYMVSLILGMCSAALHVVESGKDTELFGMVDQQKIIDAINTNNFNLALENYMSIFDWYMDNVKFDFNKFRGDYHKVFENLVLKGYKNVFKYDVPFVDYWADMCNLGDAHDRGFNDLEIPDYDTHSQLKGMLK